jgi:hypothetical protein
MDDMSDARGSSKRRRGGSEGAPAPKRSARGASAGTSVCSLVLRAPIPGAPALRSGRVIFIEGAVGGAAAGGLSLRDADTSALYPLARPHRPGPAANVEDDIMWALWRVRIFIRETDDAGPAHFAVSAHFAVVRSEVVIFAVGLTETGMLAPGGIVAGRGPPDGFAAFQHIAHALAVGTPGRSAPAAHTLALARGRRSRVVDLPATASLEGPGAGVAGAAIWMRSLERKVAAGRAAVQQPQSVALGEGWSLAMAGPCLRPAPPCPFDDDADVSLRCVGGVLAGPRASTALATLLLIGASAGQSCRLPEAACANLVPTPATLVFTPPAGIRRWRAAAALVPSLSVAFADSWKGFSAACTGCGAPNVDVLVVSTNLLGQRRYREHAAKWTHSIIATLIGGGDNRGGDAAAASHAMALNPALVSARPLPLSARAWSRVVYDAMHRSTRGAVNHWSSCSWTLVSDSFALAKGCCGAACEAAADLTDALANCVSAQGRARGGALHIETTRRLADLCARRMPACAVRVRHALHVVPVSTRWRAERAYEDPTVEWDAAEASGARAARADDERGGGGGEDSDEWDYGSEASHGAHDNDAGAGGDAASEFDDDAASEFDVDSTLHNITFGSGSIGEGVLPQPTSADAATAAFREHWEGISSAHRALGEGSPSPQRTPSAEARSAGPSPSPSPPPSSPPGPAGAHRAAVAMLVAEITRAMSTERRADRPRDDAAARASPSGTASDGTDEDFTFIATTEGETAAQGEALTLRGLAARAESNLAFSIATILRHEGGVLEDCAICCGAVAAAILPCGHELCWSCAVRLARPDDLRCPFCKTLTHIGALCEVRRAASVVTGAAAAASEAEAAEPEAPASKVAYLARLLASLASSGRRAVVVFPDRASLSHTSLYLASLGVPCCVVDRSSTGATAALSRFCTSDACPALLIAAPDGGGADFAGATDIIVPSTQWSPYASCASVASALSAARDLSPQSAGQRVTVHWLSSDMPLDREATARALALYIGSDPASIDRAVRLAKESFA